MMSIIKKCKKKIKVFIQASTYADLNFKKNTQKIWKRKTIMYYSNDKSQLRTNWITKNNGNDNLSVYIYILFLSVFYNIIYNFFFWF